MKLLITGTTGYIGQRLVLAALASGHEVIAAGRKQPQRPDVEWVRFDLTNPQGFEMPAGVDAVLHLAVLIAPNSEFGDADVLAAQVLLDASTRAGVPLLFVSSQTAQANAPTAYGRSKWQIEQSVLAHDGWVVRPGQVYGGTEAGLFGLLVRIVQRLPVLPAFLPAPHVQPVHVDDLVAAVLFCLERGPKTSVLQIAQSDPVSFTEFLHAIASGRVRKRRTFVPVPIILVKAAIAILGRERSRRIGLERLLSLFALPPMQTSADLDTLGVKLRPLSSGMARSGFSRRRWLLEEGRAILHYILRKAPSGVLVRRYVRSVEQLRLVGALDLPTWALQHPALFAMLEGGAVLKPDLRSELAWRLNAAVTLAEATPQGARRFLWLGDRREGGVIKTLQVFRALAGEVCIRLARFFVIPIVVGFKGKRGERK